MTMRISGLHSSSTFNHDPTLRPIEDMQELFGGSTHSQSTQSEILPPKIYWSDDQLITAERTGHSRDHITTTVQVQRLYLPEQAIHFTAIEAYKAKIGEITHDGLPIVNPFARLIMELPGHDTARVWESRKTDMLKREKGSDPVLPLSIVAEEMYRRRTDPAPIKRSRGLADLPRPRIKGRSSEKVSVFTAPGDNLIDAALTMQKYYRRIEFAGGDRLTIPRALGAVSMNNLVKVWNEALTKDTPKNAAMSVMRRLSNATH